MLEEKGHVPVAGVVPYMHLSLEDEDSLTDRFAKKRKGAIDLAVIHFPRISNFTDFDVFEQNPDVSVRYVTGTAELSDPDLILLPGSKNTMGDLKWMRENGLEVAIKKKAATTVIFGICGGYQMLGECIEDPYGVEEGGKNARHGAFADPDGIKKGKDTHAGRSGTARDLRRAFRAFREKGMGL